MGRLDPLATKVDAFFARVSERHGADMQCASGCADCCHVELTITEIEAAAIRALVASWPAARRAALAPGAAPGAPEARAAAPGAPEARAAAPTPRLERCAGLDATDRCKIYDARPLVCRSHGVPIRMRRGSLPVVQACHRNFTSTIPDADCILDQATLSATLYAIDAAEPRPASAPAAPAQRVELTALLAELAAIC
jgi:uncharacterized protein